MPEQVEYLLYFATATIPEIAVVLVSILTLLFSADSYRVYRQDCAILKRNGGDTFAFRESASQGRSSLGRGVIAAIFLFLGVVAVLTPARIPLVIAPLVSFVLLAAVVLILGSLQILDRRDRRENIKDLLALRRARESSAAGIIAIDRHSVILQFNAASERIFGYTAAEVIGTSMTALIPERYRADHLRGMAHAYTSNEPGPRMNQVLDLPGLRKDGTEAPLHITLTETKGVTGKVFVAIFTEEIPGSDKLARGADELRHETQMTELLHNTEVTTEARDGALEAFHSANSANIKIAETNKVAGEAATAAKESTDKLHELMEKLEGERKEREDGC